MGTAAREESIAGSFIYFSLLETPAFSAIEARGTIFCAFNPSEEAPQTKLRNCHGIASSDYLGEGSFASLTRSLISSATLFDSVSQ